MYDPREDVIKAHRTALPTRHSGAFAGNPIFGAAKKPARSGILCSANLSPYSAG
jgi:hypothetical protein